MPQKTDLTGFWRFREEFDTGEDVGEARLFQKGKNLSGHLVFKEIIPGDPAMFVRTKLTGKIENRKVYLNETSVIVLSEGKEDYVPEERKGLLNALGQIVGSGEDQQGVHGVFVLERIF
ncbi:MAG: hypothetical protein PWQ17_2119 [Anaerophaga sp.]|uniref:hypothetical protein n=1 Tax=Anaerophaga thermohalophila TaxID=177400 RepID=UPI000237B8EF|nr:hypothetical protein [Anaerophaga thermohalophila]MDI3521264.1 hypothetical protein [Anaerophaga sp.]MDK2842613.1 hypothetical protein [Anaerophaga sp.]MDN5290357.1 hypothetical protein [Anaerophaga sp.]